MFPEKRRDPCTFPGCGKQVLAKGYCSGHYKQLWKGKPLQPLRPFYGKEGRYGTKGPCRFNDLPEVRSSEWEPCSAPRYRAGWCVGHAAQVYEKRRLAPLRKRRSGCDFPECPKPHRSRGYCSGHYAQLQEGRPLTPLYQRKGWYTSNGYVYIWEPDHPNADKRGYVAEHTKVMAEMLGRPLRPSEEVHHRNKRRDDNRPENLELWARGSQPPGARVSDLLVEAWRVILLYGGDYEIKAQAMPPLAREITRR
jgi:hypothetical protein